jgi:hypothetical protein
MIYVKLFGVGCLRHCKLQLMVNEAINASTVNIDVQEYFDLDSFFAHDIKEIPALVVNDQVIDCSQYETFEAYVNLFEQTKIIVES